MKKYFPKNIIPNNSSRNLPISDNIADLVGDYSDKLVATKNPDRNEYLRRYSGQQVSKLDEQLYIAELLLADGINLHKEIAEFLTEERVNEAKERLFHRISKTNSYEEKTKKGP